MRALGDLPSQVKLAIYQLIAVEDRSKAELVFPSFKEIAQQLELETAGAGLMLMTDDCEHAQLVPKVVSCLQTVGNTISLTSVSRGVFYGPGHQHTRDVVLIQW